MKIEVKAAAYLQAWGQQKFSRIEFKIGRRRGFDAAAGTTALEPAWQADVYVFALLKHLDKATLDPLNLDQWEFYVVPTVLLNERCGTRKALSLKALRGFGVESVAFAELHAAVARLDEKTAI